MAKLAAQPGGLAVLIVLALAAPPFEEMYYRGFLYPIFERKFRPLTAGIIVTLWFTGVHVLQLAKDPIGLVPIFGMSLTATLFRVRTRSLVPAIVIHWVYNGVLVLVSLPGTQR
jgi:membrane protease YdiL (CAAX protease family)